MKDAKTKALQAKVKGERGANRKAIKERDYTIGKDKSYFDYGHQERKNIRDNAKEGSSMQKHNKMSSNDMQGYRKRFGL